MAARLGPTTSIAGGLYTVNPVAIQASHPTVFCENKRIVIRLHTARFGLVVLIPGLYFVRS